MQTETYLSKETMARGYEKRPSIVNELPWKDMNDENIFTLENSQSLGVAFEVKMIPSEARPENTLEAMLQSVADALKNSIPLEKQFPWILQATVEKIHDLEPLYQRMEKHIFQKETPAFSEAYLKTMKAHLDYVTQPGGIFYDQLVTSNQFRGGYTRVRLYLFRHVDIEKSNMTREGRVEEIQSVSEKLVDQLRSSGLKVKSIGQEVFIDLVKHFNPKPKQTGGDVNALLAMAEVPKDKNKPFGWDLSEQLFFSAPESIPEGWLFDGMPHKVLTIQSLTKEPEFGHITGERRRLVDDKVFTLIDHLPEESTFTINIVFQAVSEVELHLKKVESSIIGNHAKAMKFRGEIQTAEEGIAHGNFLYPVTMALYIKADSLAKLHERESKAEVQLNSNGFKVISEDEVFPSNAYLCYLPMCYQHTLDKKYYYRSKYFQLSDIVKLLPFYGRSTGTKNPGFLFFNRGAEGWLFDVFKDITKNAHLLLMGETGTGKSNTLTHMIITMLAIYNPRIFIVESGGSFDLLGEYCSQHGLSVNKVKIDPKNPVSLNPFAQGLKVLDQLEAFDTYQQTQYLNLLEDNLEKEREENKLGFEDPQAQEEGEESQDILGDMVLAALLMITGGERKEEERITRADRMLIMDAIIDAAKQVRSEDKKQMIASDIIDAFDRMAQRMDPVREAENIKRIREMSNSMRYFTKDPVSSRFFNTYGNPWPVTDVTIVNMGLFSSEGNEAQRSIAFAGCVSKILALAEANQHSHRPIIAVFDENHIFAKIPLLAAIQTRITKMGRKLGLWAWLATQNLEDFSDEAHKMLAMLETWICLALPPDEISQVERFKPLTSEQRALFLSAKKSPRQYTEGVLLNPKTQGLFRAIPPRLYLAMAMTEQKEKYERAKLMKEFGYTELQAVEHVAREMMKQQPKEVWDD